MPKNPPIEPKLFGTKAEHVAASRIRALEYLSHDIPAAMASLVSDLAKHAECHDLKTDAIDVTTQWASGALGARPAAYRKIKSYIESLS